MGLIDISKLELVTPTGRALREHRKKYTRWTPEETLERLENIKRIQLELAEEIDQVFEKYPKSSKLRGLLKAFEGFDRFYDQLKKDAAHWGYDAVAAKFSVGHISMWRRWHDNIPAVDICKSRFR